MKRIISLILIVLLVSSLFCGCGNETAKPKLENSKIDLGSVVSNKEGNKTVTELKYNSEEEMLSSMTLACSNENFELYYNEDNMTVALKDIKTNSVMLSNPYNAALDTNYSGSVAQRLSSQVVLSYLEKETKIVNLYSSTECAEKGQYTVNVYDNGLTFDMTFGEDNNSDNAIPKVISVEGYKAICKKISEDSKELLGIYYTFYKKSDLSDSGVLEIYPDIKKQDLYFCNTELSDRDKRKLDAVFEEAEYSDKDKKADAEILELGDSTENTPLFKLSLQYALTNNGVTVNIPNKSLEYNEQFPLLRVSVLPYFGSDSPNPDANGYLFIPDGTGALINMNQDEPNRRTIITGKVYGENSSTLPKKTAVEKTEQYYLPVFGTVRNNNTALFGIIKNGDANSEITSLLGRPNGNYYTVNPEFIVADYEQYTRVSVVDNNWSNKTLYLYDKNATKDDFTVDYTFLTNEKANYSSMADVYRNYLYKETNKKTNKPTVNIETIGSALVEKTVFGVSYDSEAVFTEYDDNIDIIKYLKKNNVDNISLMLRGWQKDGLDASVSNKIRVSKALGGKSQLTKLADYCKKENIAFSLYNDLVYVAFDNSFDGFKSKTDATKTLEYKYAKNSALSPDTLLYDEGKYVVKPSVYGKYLSSLLEKSDDYSLDSMNIGTLGYSLNADYTKDNCINRSEALSYVKSALENNKKSLSFEKGNAYVLPFATAISNISVDDSGFIGETASVPFLQMVIGNNATYTSSPVNLKEDNRLELLKCIEGGTVPTFMLSFNNTSALKNTEYTNYYSIDYSIVKDTILEDYAYVNKVLKATDKTAVVNHRILASGVTVSTYENGTMIYVNKTDEDYVFEGTTVKKKDYLIKE